MKLTGLVELGYKKNIDLVAAPYDFRRGAYRQISYDEVIIILLFIMFEEQFTYYNN